MGQAIRLELDDHVDFIVSEEFTMISEERYKQLMDSVGMPNSRSLLQALQQCAMEAALTEREECAKIAEKYEPDEKLDYVTYASRDIRSR